VISDVDEQYVVRFLAFLQYENANRNAGGIEQIGWQADYSIDVTVVEKLATDAFLGTITEQNAMGQNDRYHPFVFKVAKAMQ